MENYLETKTLIKKLKKEIEVLAEKYDIHLAMLFGSFAKAAQNKLSDIDVSFYLDNTSEKEDYFKTKLDLIDLLQVLNKNIDVVIMNQAPPLLNYQIMKYGKLLFEKRSGLYQKIYSYAMRRHFDFRYFSRLHDERLLKRLREGNFGG